jgi:hypothetical protein
MNQASASELQDTVSETVGFDTEQKSKFNDYEQ